MPPSAEPTFGNLIAATSRARRRLNDPRIGTKAAKGLIRVVRVTYDARGRSTVEHLSEPLLLPDAIAFLDALQ